MRQPIVFAMFMLAGVCASAQSILAGGHVKARVSGIDYPDDSLYALFTESPAIDQAADFRLKLRQVGGAWDFAADYQLVGQYGDSVSLIRDASSLIPGGAGIQNDDHRLMDLTWDLAEGDDYHTLHRLDRLQVSYTTDKWATRVGRQAIGWGNGFFYNPVDFFNPFDPAAVDKEYKTGDDMAYTQYLRDNGDDVQMVWVVRRDQDENLSSDVNSIALKYHGFAGEVEYDLLLAEHFQDTIGSIGAIVPWGGAIVRGDLVLTDTGEDTVVSAVASWSYSWSGFGKNMVSALEYFHNGFGLNEGFTQEDLVNEPDLLARLIRGELFTRGRNYLAASVSVEMSPLFSIAPNVFLNLEDQSFLAQLSGTWDVRQDWQLLFAVNVPVGDDGTEFGGFESSIDGVKLTQGASIFAQVAYYF